MFDPGPVRLHGEDGHLARHSRTCSTSTARCGETLKLIAKEKGIDVGDVDGDHARPPAPRGRGQGDPRGRRAHPLHPPRRRLGGAARPCTRGSPVDLLWGIGGTPEGVISAAAIKCMGGQMLGRLWPRNDEERQAALDAGYDLDEVLDTRPPGVRRRRRSSPPPASPTATCSTACTSRRRAPRPSRSSMRSRSGHGAHDHRPPRPREAPRDHGRAGGLASASGR